MVDRTGIVKYSHHMCPCIGSFGRPDHSPEVLRVWRQLVPRLREFQPMDEVWKSIAGGIVCNLTVGREPNPNIVTV